LLAPGTPGDRRLLPQGDRLVPVRVDELPDRAACRAAWATFWKLAAGRYAWNPGDGGMLKK